MTVFLDKDGFPLTMGTALSNVNLQPTTRETIESQRFLDAWDATKPKLGRMDQLVSYGRMVPDPALKNDKPAVYVTTETWFERFDREKPNLGTIQLPEYGL